MSMIGQGGSFSLQLYKSTFQYKCFVFEIKIGEKSKSYRTVPLQCELEHREL